MPARWITPTTRIEARRGEVVVCIPVYAGHEHFVGCLRSVLAHTPPDVPILVCDDASPDDRSEQLVRKLHREGIVKHELFYVRRTENVGFPANVNDAFARCAPADVLLLNSDCVVADGWLDGLREAAGSQSNVATATSLTNHGSIVSVPERGVSVPRLPQDWSLDDAAAAVRARSPRLHPRLLTAIGHCVYVRRTALELVGDFDLAFSPGYGEEVDFSQRCLRAGLCHVAADDVLVFHHGGGSFATGGKASSVQTAHERILATRYPYYHDAVRAVERDFTGPLSRSLSAARRALTGLTVVIDGRILTGPMTGTQLHVLELIAALARTGEPRLKVVVPPDLSGYARDALADLESVETVRPQTGTRTAQIRRVDVVHRPFQVSTAEDIPLLAQLGERLVVTQQDLIGYHNPSYFRSYADWESYRRLARRVLAAADRVLFFSAHARDDALAEDLIDGDRACVVQIGADHALTRGDPVLAAPRAAARLPGEAEVILCIGTDFHHKNRVFALRVLDELQRRRDWKGCLVFAGPHVAVGSSAPDEDEMLILRPRLGDVTIDVAAVREGEKAWLMKRARLVLYPTVYEGFGLVPFEAAGHGVPCMWAAGTSLSEILPEAAASIVPWDAAATADVAFELMSDQSARDRNVSAVREAAAKFTWDATAARLLEIYRDVCDGPASPARAVELNDVLVAPGMSQDALRLVGPHGALPAEMERPLLALATHPSVSRSLFGAIKSGYRAAYHLRRIAAGNGRPNE